MFLRELGNWLDYEISEFGGKFSISEELKFQMMGKITLKLIDIPS